MSINNIDVSRLRSALYTCKNSINYSTTENLINSISNDNVWSTDSQKKLKKSLEKLVNVRYKNLKEQLDQYLGITSQIEEYQMLKKENDNLDVQYNSLNSRLYYTIEEPYTIIDEDGNEIEQYRTITAIDCYVEDQISRNRKKYRDNKNKMEDIKSSIDNSM